MPLLQLFYPDKGNFIAVVDQMGSGKSAAIKSAINANTNLQAYSINAPSFITEVDFSDHRNFWQFDYPAVMVTNTAFYRNHRYHTERDTYDTLDYKKMADVIYGTKISVFN